MGPYIWPFGLAGYCQRDGRLFFLAVGDCGLVYLLKLPRPILISVSLITHPFVQTVVHPRHLSAITRMHARRTARQAMRNAVIEEAMVGRDFHQLPLPPIPDGIFPLPSPSTRQRDRLIQLHLGQQSQFRHH